MSRMPFAMAKRVWDRLSKLPEDRLVRVLERSAIILDGNPGMSWAEADELAMAQEGMPSQKTLEVA